MSFGTEWALLQGGAIVNVVTATTCKRHMQEKYPEYQIAALYSLPQDVREAYQYWSERP